MNKQYIAKATANYPYNYFVSGSGFVGSKALATKLSEDNIQCLKNLGYTFTTEEVVQKSFAVCYIRKGDVNANFTVRANALNPSRRRFATREEAVQHGSRFGVRKAKGSTVAGSAGHVGFYVVETTDPVNATVNPKTGLTNAL